MHPLYNPAQEHNWLQQIVDWSLKEDEVITSLQQEGDDSPDTAKQLTKWRKRFAQLRKLAENRKTATVHGYVPSQATYATPYLLERSHQLHYRFSQFLQDRLLHRIPGVIAVSDTGDIDSEHEEDVQAEEDSQIEGEKEKEMTLRPVPIGGHTLPPLPYPYNALEPYIDEKTMHLHHDKHHKSYVEGLNKAEKEMEKARQSGNFSLIKHWEREAAFNGAGHYLHTIFWKNMKPKGGGKATGAIAREINRTFGGFEKFKQHFSAAAEKVEGGGWALLIWAPRAHRVEILQAEKHQNLSQQDMIPILVLDVWEHAYYLKYNSDRKAYIDAWWHVVDWDNVNYRFLKARKVKWKPF